MLSVTILSSYLYCARKLYIERVLGIRSPIPKIAIVKGSIRHNIYEEINKSEKAIISSIRSDKFEDILAVYKQKFLEILKKQIIKDKYRLKSIEMPLEQYFKDTWPLIAQEADFRAHKIFDFTQKTGFLGNELWENLTPKVKSEYRLESRELMLRGIIDELEVHDGFFVPVELKTGSAPKEGVWPGHKIQVGAYAMLLEDHFKVPVQKAIIRYLDSQQVREVMINPFLREEIKDIISQVQELLDSKELPDFCSNENKCKNCDLKEACRDEGLLEQKTKDLNIN
jgi:CRISPR-associated exonuclease Cas4